MLGFARNVVVIHKNHITVAKSLNSRNHSGGIVNAVNDFASVIVHRERGETAVLAEHRVGFYICARYRQEVHIVVTGAGEFQHGAEILHLLHGAVDFATARNNGKLELLDGFYVPICVVDVVTENLQQCDYIGLAFQIFRYVGDKVAVSELASVIVNRCTHLSQSYLVSSEES